MFGAEVDVGGSDGAGSMRGRLYRGCRHKRCKLGGRASGGQQGRVASGHALKVGGADRDGEGGEAVHGGHAADQGLLRHMAIDEVAYGSSAQIQDKGSPCSCLHCAQASIGR